MRATRPARRPPPRTRWLDIPPLNDLFDGDSYEYIGTVEIPESLKLMAGDSERIAGVYRDELGVHSVRVLRVEGLKRDPRERW